MAMEQAEVEALVGRMEKFAVDQPAAYRRRVIGLALLGYGYLAMVVLALLALVIADFVYFKRAAFISFFIIGAPLILVLRAMWFKFVPPPGERLTRQAVPDLFHLLDRLCERLETPPLQEVVLVSAYFAGITQVPRLGLFGWHRNYLAIGLPLMKSLTVEQFQAVVAHELGHLSHGHGKAAHWIYRLRLILARLEGAFRESPQWGLALIRTFFKWYIPYFNATSFPLARANEYEADAAAVQLTSASDFAQALIAADVMGRLLKEKYWPSILELAKDSPEPVQAPFTGFAAMRDLPAGELRGWQHAALSTKTSYADTHPCLSDRLKAIGAEAEFVLPAAGESAEQLLGTELERIESALVSQWRARMAQPWKTLHDNAQKNRLRLAELRSLAAAGELEELKALELSNLEESVGRGPAAALEMQRALVDKYPESLPARFALARQLLQNREAMGVAPMESVIANDINSVLAGSELLRNYYWRCGEKLLASQWHERYVERAKVIEAAKRERARFLVTDRVAPHGLSSETLAQIVSQLKSVPDVSRAYLVRKLTLHSSDRPLYVLGFTCRKWWEFSDRARAKAVSYAIRDQLKFPASIVNLEASSARYTRKFRRVEESRIL